MEVASISLAKSGNQKHLQIKRLQFDHAVDTTKDSINPAPSSNLHLGQSFSDTKASKRGFCSIAAFAVPLDCWHHPQ